MPCASRTTARPLSGSNAPTWTLSSPGSSTTVQAELRLVREAGETARDLRLDGVELELESISLDGVPLPSDRYAIDDQGLTVRAVPDAFVLRTTVRITPHLNTSLEGLYLSSGNFCTQCEAEGFRKITYYLDRPDILSRFTTTIRADPARWPVMLSNGNRVGSGQSADGTAWCRWEDPFPKPSYLFALVAGKLSFIEDQFTTASGREVDLRIYVEPHNIDKCDHAMASLKRAMRWDEDVYGREYDLDVFMIVAVDDFNMGAMENKGLNIFNSKYVLARPDTATDNDFTAIEAVIAHEYFHNWTGNRVTCRDWFQLSLKEGLTVFRDQEFSADVASRAVKRIQDVRLLRSHQFPEDSGPMAHPVRPDSYLEINNFYTVTIYNKGAELIRMLHAFLGPDRFRKGLNLYFDRHDGQAVTTEDFVRALEDANAADFRQFRRWYTQAGTPTVRVSRQFDAGDGSLELVMEQETPPTPGQPGKESLQIPVRLALLDADGQRLSLAAGRADSSGNPVEFVASRNSSGSTSTETVVNLNRARRRLRFTGLDSPPVPSIGRGFSAPAHFEVPRDDDELAFLMAHDDDAFNRWDAAQTFAFKVLDTLLETERPPPPSTDSSEQSHPLDRFVAAFERTLTDQSLDPALAAEALRLPSESNLADRCSEVDPDAVHRARSSLRKTLAERLDEQLASRFQSLASNTSYRFEALACGRRSLKNLCLGYLMERREDQYREWCRWQLERADNMTDALGALAALSDDPHPSRLEAMAQFRQRWQNEPLVLDKWFTLRATSALPGTLAEVKELLSDPAFDLKNPNRVRALVGAFAHGNPVHFHAIDGSGYAFTRARVLELDALNPQVAARLVGAFSRWRRLEPTRRSLMREELENILGRSGLSPDTYEIVSKTLA